MRQLTDESLCLIVQALVSSGQILNLFCFYKKKYLEIDGSGRNETTLANIATGHSAVGALLLPSVGPDSSLIMRTVLPLYKREVKVMQLE